MTGPGRRLRLAAALGLLAAAGAASAQAAAAAGGPPGGPHAPPGPPPRTVQVGGEGRVSVAPDVAVFSVGVETLGRTVGAATGEATARMKAVLDALAQAGVPARDVRTTRYDVSVERPWKDGKPGPITGYRVSNSAEAKVRDLARLGAVLEKVTAAGSNQVGALQMVRDDPSPQRMQALAQAYADARRKAEALATAAGARLGEPLSIQEAGAVRPMPGPMLMRSAMADAAPVPVAEGELEVSARVEVTFSLR